MSQRGRQIAAQDGGLGAAADRRYTSCQNLYRNLEDDIDSFLWKQEYNPSFRRILWVPALTGTTSVRSGNW